MEYYLTWGWELGKIVVPLRMVPFVINLIYTWNYNGYLLGISCISSFKALVGVVKQLYTIPRVPPFSLWLSIWGWKSPRYDSYHQRMRVRNCSTQLCFIAHWQPIKIWTCHIHKHVFEMHRAINDARNPLSLDFSHKTGAGICCTGQITLTLFLDLFFSGTWFNMIEHTETRLYMFHKCAHILKYMHIIYSIKCIPGSSERPFWAF